MVTGEQTYQNFIKNIERFFSNLFPMLYEYLRISLRILKDEFKKSGLTAEDLFVRISLRILKDD